jgi:hypothetical protein
VASHSDQLTDSVNIDKFIPVICTPNQLNALIHLQGESMVHLTPKSIHYSNEFVVQNEEIRLSRVSENKLQFAYKI